MRLGEKESVFETAFDAPSEEVFEHIPHGKPEPPRVPLLANYFFCALAGDTWYMQFFFYTMGETQMGEYEFSSWTLHMASIIIFSTLVGHRPARVEGRQPPHDRPRRARAGVLVGSTIIVGYGNYLATLHSDPERSHRT